MLSDLFLIELFVVSLRDVTIFLILKENLKYQYLPSDSYKTLWKYMVDSHNVNEKLPSIGMLSQAFQSNPKIMSIIAEIKKTDLPDKDGFINSFELFVKDSKFLEFFAETKTDYMNDDKKSVFSKTIQYADWLNTFSLKPTLFTSVFKSFNDRVIERQLQKQLGHEKKNFVYGIDELDARTGGFQEGNLIGFLGATNSGKSPLLKHVAISNARRGCKVAHFQLEDTKDMCLDLYDAAWTGSLITDIENLNLSDKQYNELITVSTKITGDIFIDAVEKFDSITVNELNRRFRDLEKAHGKIDLVIIDYLELLDIAKVYKDERMRRIKIAELLKNFAIINRVAVVTATQASDVPRELMNNELWVITRNNIAEAKGLPRPFNVFITINQTEDEYENSICRLYADKLRKGKRNFVVKIAQAQDRGRFYDRTRSLREFYKGAELIKQKANIQPISSQI